MPQCAVTTCTNSHRKTKGRRIRYHRFPTEASIRTRWVAVCGRSAASTPNFNAATARVCSRHFSPRSYERDVEHELLGLPPRGRLRRGAVPDRAIPLAASSSPPPPPPPTPKTRPRRGARNSSAPTAATTTITTSNNKNKTTNVIVTPTTAESPPPLDASGINILLALGLTPTERYQPGCYPYL